MDMKGYQRVKNKLQLWLVVVNWCFLSWSPSETGKASSNCIHDLLLQDDSETLHLRDNTIMGGTLGTPPLQTPPINFY